MRVGIFGGSFDPVHSEHVRCGSAAIGELGLRKLLVVPSFLAPHKPGGACAGGEDRLRLCRIAFRNVEKAEISDFELKSGGTSYTYLTCRAYREMFPNDELYWLVGADMLEDFFTWKNPREILSCVTLAAFGRGTAKTEGLHARFLETFGTDFCDLHVAGESVSSTELRVALAFGKTPLSLDPEVLGEIERRKLYRYPEIPRALSLEKEERREHSFRVAKMACCRARSLGIPGEKALLAAAFHDCGKYVVPSSPLLKGFTPPDDVPEPVIHQFTGAYLAEHVFHVSDGEILDAIRYHTSGREDMTKLGKLIFLSDLLEEGRDFPGVEELRALFWKDLDRCLCESLSRQVTYLQSTGKPVFSLTERAYEWAKTHLL